MFNLFKGTADISKEIERQMEDYKYPYWYSYSIPAIDVVYTCNNCRKNIGLESRFVFDKMGFNCPYCAHSLMIRDEEEPKPQNEGDEE